MDDGVGRPGDPRAAVAAARRAARPRFYILLALILLCVIDDRLHPWTLVNQVPLAIKGPSIVLGLLVGCWLSFAMVRIQDASNEPPNFRFYVAFIAAPLFLAPMGSYVGRRVFETAAFWGVRGQLAEPVEAIVADVDTKWKDSVLFRLKATERTFWADTPGPIDIRWIGTHCVSFGAYRGRYGAVRVFIPALEPESFEPCSTEAVLRFPDLRERAARIAQMQTEKNEK